MLTVNWAETPATKRAAERKETAENLIAIAEWATGEKKSEGCWVERSWVGEKNSNEQSGWERTEPHYLYCVTYLSLHGACLSRFLARARDQPDPPDRDFRSRSLNTAVLLFPLLCCEKNGIPISCRLRSLPAVQVGDS